MTGYITFYSSAEINELELSQFASDLLKQAGVIRQSGSLGFAAAQLSPLDGRKYNVTTGGIAYVPNSNYAANGTNPRFWLTRFSGATETLTFAANSSGSTRIDLICVKVDTTVTDANPDNTGVASLVVVQGTPGAGVPATPDNHLALYQVTVANGATEITSANVADVRVEAYIYIPESLTLSGNVISETNKLVDQAFDGWIPSGETWTYASADDPTFTFTISGDKTAKYQKGMRIKITQATGGTKYFLITNVAYSAPNTTVTIYGGVDYDLNNQTISSPYFSREKAPTGFPLNPALWSVSLLGGYNSQSSPTQNTWYNLGNKSITVPIGSWEWSLTCTVGVQMGSNAANSVSLALATVNNGVTGDILGATVVENYGTRCTSVISGRGLLSLTSKTTYYLNERTKTASVSLIDNGGNDGAQLTLRFTCAYL